MKIDLKGKKILHLPLKKAPFDVMITGEKQEEYRSKSAWMHSRLFNKDGSFRSYDYILFRNGYSKSSPWLLTEYEGARELPSIDNTYSNGLQVKSDNPLYGILLGRVIEYGNVE